MNKEEIRILFESADDDNTYNPTKDASNYNIKDERKPVITLGTLNRLKIMRYAKRKEQMQDNSFIPVIYSSSDDSDGGMPPM